MQIATRRHERALRHLVLALATYVAVGTLAATMTFTSPHHDMLETWVWGQHLSFGYHKHPPLSGWITGLWFRLVPRYDWTFYLLAYVNAALGLCAVWLAAGRLLSGNARTAAVLLLALTLFFTFSPAKFNANTVLLSAWPWTVYLFIRSFAARTFASGVALGVVAGLAMLGKYYSVLLLASCLWAALLHAEARAYFRSPAPYAAVAALVATMTPHLVWLVQHDFQTVAYAMAKTRPHLGEVVGRGSWAMFAALLLHIPAAAALLWASELGWREALQRLGEGVREPSNRWLLALVLGPYLLTYVACVFGHVRISLQFMIPIFFLWPAVALRLMACTISRRRLRGLAVAASAVGAAAVVSAPLVSISDMKLGYPALVEPRLQVTAEAERLWHASFRRPLTIVGGSQGYAEAIAFYGADAPSELIELEYRYAPWITPGRVAREGALFVCEKHNAKCLDRARAVAGDRAITYERAYRARKWGVGDGLKAIVFVVLPPAA